MKKKVQQVPWLEPFKQFLKTLDPEEAMKGAKYEKAFAAGWESAMKSKKKK